MLSKLGSRIWRTGVLLSGLAVLPNTACGGSRPSVNIVASSNVPGDESVKVGKLIEELNGLIPQKPLRGIKAPILICEDPSYTADHKIIYNRFYGLDSVVHEMGHAIYDVLLNEKSDDFSFKVKDELWMNLYSLSLGFGNYEIVKDSNYIGKIICGEVDLTARTGHPWEHPSELFASSLMIYRMHADQFIAKINDPSVSRETREFGKLIFLYMRDRVFKGKIFSAVDPFKGENINDYDPGSIVNKGFSALANALDQNVPIPDNLKARSEKIKTGAIRAVFSLRKRDDRFYNLLYRAFIKNTGNTRFLTLDLFRDQIKSTYPMPKEQMIPIILIALNDDDPLNRSQAAGIIDGLGLRDERFIEAFIKAMKGGDRIVQRIGIKYLSENGDKNVIPALEILTGYIDDVGEAAKQAIRKIKEREKNQ